MKSQMRIRQAFFGVAVLLCVGMVYAWSVLSGPIAAEYPGWSKAQLSLTFTIVMIMFCIGCLVGGFLNRKLSSGVFLWISSVLFLTGFIITSRMHSRVMLYLGFGVICGFASGLAYNAVMGTVGKWFPDCQGLISGILLMGFGLSSFIVGKLYQAFTPETTGAWRNSFLIIGIIIAAVLAVCGFVIRPPRDEEKEAFLRGNGNASQKQAGKAGKTGGAVNPVAMETETSVMLRRPGFWLYFLWAILVSAAGLALVSQAGGIAREVGDTVSAGTIATVVGLISIFNGIGRVIFGSLYDKAGRSFVMQAVNVLFIVTAAIIFAALKGHSFALLIAGFVLGGISYGGVTPTNSAFISSYYGMLHYPMNFAVINTNLILASFGSTIAGALYDSSQSYMSTCLMMCLLAAVGILASLGINAADRHLAEQIRNNRL
ncbi:MAG: MFS transporter [Lachnospiraceae bacterium]|nr:MFS transporter [Lachnospiraceae bacterium]